MLPSFFEFIVNSSKETCLKCTSVIPNSLITSNGHFQPWYAISTSKGTITIDKIPNCVNLNNKNKNRGEETGFFAVDDQDEE